VAQYLISIASFDEVEFTVNSSRFPDSKKASS